MAPYYLKEMPESHPSPAGVEGEGFGRGLSGAAGTGATRPAESTYLVLGADGENTERDEVKELFEQRDGVTAIGIEDSTYEKLEPFEALRTLSDYADYIVLVDSGDYGSGLLVELGNLVTNSMTYRKLFVLVKEPAERQMPWMLQEGVYELLERDGRLFEWSDRTELADIVESLPADSA
jgi:hypothetical protein